MAANKQSDVERLELAVRLLTAAVTSVASFLKRSPEMEARDCAERVIERVRAIDQLNQRAERKTTCRA